MANYPNWLVQLKLDNSEFLAGMQGATRAVHDFEQTLQFMRYSGINAIMSLYQAAPMLQGAFQGVTGVIKDAIGAFGKYESTLTSLEFLASNMGTTAGELKLALETLTSDGLLTMQGAMEALKNTFTLDIPIQDAVQSLQLLKNAMLMAGKPMDELTNIITSIRTMNSQRLDEYGITKNLNQMLVEQVAYMNKIANSKAEQAKADSFHLGILKQIAPELAKHGKLTKDNISESLRSNLLVYASAQEVRDLYTAKKKLDKDEKENAKDPLRERIFVEGARRQAKMVVATAQAHKQGVLEFSKKFDEVVASEQVFAKKTDAAQKIIDLALKRKVIERPEDAGRLMTIGLGGNDPQQNKKAAAAWKTSVDYVNAQIENYMKTKKASQPAYSPLDYEKIAQSGDAKKIKAFLAEIGADAQKVMDLSLAGGGSQAIDTLENNLSRVTNQLKTFQVGLGRAFSEPLKEGAKYIADFLENFNEMGEVGFKNIATILTLAAAITGLGAALLGAKISMMALTNVGKMMLLQFEGNVAGIAALATRLPIVGTAMAGMAQNMQRALIAGQRAKERMGLRDITMEHGAQQKLAVDDALAAKRRSTGNAAAVLTHDEREAVVRPIKDKAGEAGDALRRVTSDNIKTLGADVRTTTGMLSLMKFQADAITGSMMNAGRSMMAFNASWSGLAQGATYVNLYRNAVASLTGVSGNAVGIVRALGTAFMSTGSAVVSMINPLNMVVRGFGLAAFAAGATARAVWGVAVAIAGLAAELVFPLLIIGSFMAVMKLWTSTMEFFKAGLGSAAKEGLASVVAWDRIDQALKSLDKAFARVRASVVTFLDAVSPDKAHSVHDLGATFVEFAAILMNTVAAAIEWIMKAVAMLWGAFQGFINSGIVAQLGDTIKWAFDAGGKAVETFMGYLSQLGGMLGPLTSMISSMGSTITSALSNVPLLGGIIKSVQGAIAGASEAGKRFDDNRQKNIDAQLAVKKDTKDDKNRPYTGKPALGFASGDDKKKKGGKDPITEALSLLKLKRDLAIANSQVDTQVVSARAAYYNAVKTFQGKGKDAHQKLQIQKDIVDAWNDLLKAEADLLEHQAQKLAKAAEQYETVWRNFYKIQNDLAGFRSKITGDKVTQDIMAAETEIKTAAVEAKAAEMKMESAEKSLAAAKKKAEAGGADSESNKNAAIAAEKAVGIARQAALEAKIKADTAKLEGERKKGIAQANKDIGTADLNISKLEAERNGRGLMPDIEQMKTETENKIRGLASLVRNDPASGNDPMKKKEHIDKLRSAYSALTAEMIKVAESTQEPFAVAAEQAKAAQELSFQSMTDMLNQVGAVNQEIEKLQGVYDRQAEKARILGDVINKNKMPGGDSAKALAAEKELAYVQQQMLTIEKGLNVRVAERMVLETGVTAMKQRMVDFGKEELKQALLQNKASQDRYNLEVAFNKAGSDAAAGSGGYDAAAAGYKELILSKTHLIRLAEEELALLLAQGASNADKYQQELKIAELRASRDEDRTSRAIETDRGSFLGFGNGEKTVVAGELERGMKASQDILNSGASEEEKTVARKRYEAQAKEYSRIFQEEFKTPIELHAKLVANVDQLGKDVANAFSESWKQAIASGDWTELGMNISKKLNVSFKSFIGSAVTDFMTVPLENTFKKISDFMKNAGTNLSNILKDTGKFTAAQLGQIAGGVDMFMGAISGAMLLWSSMTGGGGKGEQTIKEGNEAFDQTENVRGVVVGETNLGIGKLKELFDPIAISMQVAAEKLSLVADRLAGLGPSIPTVPGGSTPVISTPAPGGGNNVITLNLNTTGTITVIADIPKMQKELNATIQDTVKRMVTKEITDQIGR